VKIKTPGGGKEGSPGGKAMEGKVGDGR
jgi:hypothetical protein